MLKTPGRGRAVTSCLAALALLALTACGSETESSAEGGDGSKGEGFDVSSATLTEDPFCESLDTTLVAEVLSVPAASVKLQVEREVGEEFEGPNEEGTPPKSVANLCVLGSSTKQFLVSVQPDASADDVQTTLDELELLSDKSSSEVCEPTDASEFGDPAGAFTCETATPLERVRVVATGLVGTSKFFCSAVLNEGAGPELPTATFDACRTFLEELATPA